MEWPFRKHRVPTSPPPLAEMVAVLLDKAASTETRAELATELAESDEDAVFNALLRVAADHSEPPDVLEAFGEALGEMWHTRGVVPPAELIRSLAPIARAHALASLPPGTGEE
jgi:hypothetical protein